MFSLYMFVLKDCNAIINSQGYFKVYVLLALHITMVQTSLNEMRQ